MFILLIGFNSFVFSVYSENLSNRDSLYEEDNKYDRYGRRLNDEDVFTDHIEGSNSTLDYKTITNNTDNVMYVQVSYGGAISFGRYGSAGRSYWNAYLQPKECIKFYQSNSNMSPDFDDPFVSKIELMYDNGKRRFCYPCGNTHFTMKDFFIRYHLSEGDDEFNNDCDDKKDFTWYFPPSSSN